MDNEYLLLIYVSISMYEKRKGEESKSNFRSIVHKKLLRIIFNE